MRLRCGFASYLNDNNSREFNMKKQLATIISILAIGLSINTSALASQTQAVSGETVSVSGAKKKTQSTLPWRCEIGAPYNCKMW